MTFYLHKRGCKPARGLNIKKRIVRLSAGIHAHKKRHAVRTLLTRVARLRRGESGYSAFFSYNYIKLTQNTESVKHFLFRPLGFLKLSFSFFKILQQPPAFPRLLLRFSGISRTTSLVFSKFCSPPLKFCSPRGFCRNFPEISGVILLLLPGCFDLLEDGVRDV